MAVVDRRDIADLGNEEWQVLVDAIDNGSAVLGGVDPNVGCEHVAQLIPLLCVHQTEIARLQLMNLIKVGRRSHYQSVPLSTTRDAPVVVLAASDAR